MRLLVILQWLLLLLLTAACALGCNRGGGSNGAGAQIYATNACATCHGDDLAGKPQLGPPLKGLSAHWSSQEELVKYLANPTDYLLGDQRLRERAKDYNMAMPVVPMSDEDRATLASWLLNQ